MEKSTDHHHRPAETHDFMNVESFSQLPFIRPAPPVKDKGAAIRLFGKEFGGEYSTGGAVSDESAESAAQVNNNSGRGDQESTNMKDGLHDNNGESSRKFECHYCCRNFPTSQALGGHQNAHKRERQHAKRAHLQSAMVHGGLTEAHVYGLMNYRLGAALPTPPNLAFHHHHHSWSSTKNTNSARFYGTAASNNNFSQPPATINGSPLALWRINPPTHHGTTSPTIFGRDDSMMHHPNHNPLPLFANDDVLKPRQVMSSASQTLLTGYESSKPKMKDHVSLDLHL